MTVLANQKKLSNELVSLLEETDLTEHYELPKDIDFKTLLRSKIYLVFIIREGLPYSVFNTIQSSAPFSVQDWSRLLNISSKSLQRYKVDQTRFKPLQTEKILEMTEVLSVGMELFGDLDKFKHWLVTANYALGNMEPMDLLSDSYGKDLVMAELIRLNEGIFV